MAAALEYALLDSLNRYIAKKTQSPMELERNPKAKLLIVEREGYLQDIILSSLPIIRIYGDWGQGKSTLGMLLYRIAILNNNNSFYLTYLPLAKIAAELKEEGIPSRKALWKFYTSSEALRDKGFDKLFQGVSPTPARYFIQLLMPLMFSPNHVKEIYGLQGRGVILTSLPRTLELNPEEYFDKTPYDVAKSFVDRIEDKRYIICLDELEGIPSVGIEPQYFGPLLELARRLYDLYGYNKVTFVFLIQETERPAFDRMLEEIRTQRELSRIYGVIGSPVRLEKMSSEELKEYALMILKEILGTDDESVIETDVIDNIVKEASKAANTRIATSVLRALLLQTLVKVIVKNLELQEIPKHEEILDNIRELAKKKKIKITLESYEKVNVPSQLRDVFRGNYSRLNKYTENMLKVISEEVYNKLKDRVDVSSPSLRSKWRGYVSYQLLVKPPQPRGKPMRIILWMRLSRFYKRPPKEKLLQYLGFKAKDERSMKTELEAYLNKILFLHPPTTKGALIQELDPELIVPIEMGPDDIASALIKAGVVECTIISDVRESLQEHFKRNLVPRIVSVIDSCIKSR